MGRVYNALDVSRYVINYSNDKGYDISNLKLQKLLYFIQAYFLIKSKGERPCFDDRIEAWDFGPVVPSVYHEYKRYASMNIPASSYYYEVDDTNIWNIEKKDIDFNNITDDDKQLIENIVDSFSNYSASNLVQITHKQAPWQNAYQPHMNNEITVKGIWDYFNER